jgi:hypothetical protein
MRATLRMYGVDMVAELLLRRCGGRLFQVVVKVKI